jgi:hypothetical protein
VIRRQGVVIASPAFKNQPDCVAGHGIDAAIPALRRALSGGPMTDRARRTVVMTVRSNARK